MLLFSIDAASMAQDRRIVVEPIIPPVCASLHATLALHGSVVDAKDEIKLDTARMQSALDSCGNGRALELASNGAANAFLIGPITIPTGVTLLMLDNPQDYQLTAANASVSYGPGPVNFRMTGNNVTASGTPAGGTLASCSAMYVPFEVHP